VNTSHILFIASGAFHIAKPSDLLPELQGRLPIRVELKPLTESDFRRILLEPKFSLIDQHTRLLATEGVELIFEESAIHKIASICWELNQSIENIGARRLRTVLSKVLEDISFSAEDYKGTQVRIDSEFVSSKVESLLEKTDLSRYIL
jgi:ATP-dependent HslUV protease ATP-binding subunit HslU